MDFPEAKDKYWEFCMAYMQFRCTCVYKTGKEKRNESKRKRENGEEKEIIHHLLEQSPSAPANAADLRLPLPFHSHPPVV